MDNNHEVLKPFEAADYLRIHKRTLMRLVKARKIKGVKVGGQLRFHKSVLEKFLEISTPSPSPREKINETF